MGVAAVETINVEEDTDHDEDIARGVALEEHMSGQEPPASKSVTASTSSTSSSTASASSKMKLNIHLQDTTQKFRATAASRRHDQVTNEMLNLIKDANKQANEEDDELDLSFASMAKRMRKNLNEKQREKVLSGIQKLVSSAIENAEAGLPVIPRHRICCNLYLFEHLPPQTLVVLVHQVPLLHQFRIQQGLLVTTSSHDHHLLASCLLSK